MHNLSEAFAGIDAAPSSKSIVTWSDRNPTESVSPTTSGLVIVAYASANGHVYGTFHVEEIVDEELSFAIMSLTNGPSLVRIPSERVLKDVDAWPAGSQYAIVSGPGEELPVEKGGASLVEQFQGLFETLMNASTVGFGGDKNESGPGIFIQDLLLESEPAEKPEPEFVRETFSSARDAFDAYQEKLEELEEVEGEYPEGGYQKAIARDFIKRIEGVDGEKLREASQYAEDRKISVSGYDGFVVVSTMAKNI